MAALAHTPNQSRLLSLPDELLLAVVEQLSSDTYTLRELALTNRYFQALCENWLYSSITLRDISRLLFLLQTFSARPERLQAVQTLNILYEYDDCLDIWQAERESLIKLVPGMSRLKNWWIESPYDNLSRWRHGSTWVQGDMEEIRRVLEGASVRAHVPNISLENLEKIVLHTHGHPEDFWNLADFDCLFLQKNLKHLHLSCVNFIQQRNSFATCANTTALTTLILDECNISAPYLRCILTLPKALKHLTLGENVHNKRPNDPCTPLNRNAEEALWALLPVAHSLESLTHNDPDGALTTAWNVSEWFTSPLKGPGLRDFHNLTEISCDPTSFLHRCILQSPAITPSNLAILRLLRRDKNDPQTTLENLPDVYPYIRLPNFAAIEIVQSISRNRLLGIDETLWGENRANIFHSWAYKLWEKGIETFLYVQIHTSAFPPYLNGELVPEPVLIHDPEFSTFGDQYEVTPEEQKEYLRIVNQTRALHGLSPQDRYPGSDANDTSVWVDDDLGSDHLSEGAIIGLMAHTRYRINSWIWKTCGTADTGSSDLDSDEYDSDSDDLHDEDEYMEDDLLAMIDDGGDLMDLGSDGEDYLDYMADEQDYVNYMADLFDENTEMMVGTLLMMAYGVDSTDEDEV